MTRKKRILLIFTGGTIVSGFHGKGKDTGPSKKMFKSLTDYVEKFFQGKKVELIFREPLGVPGEDSTNLGPEHWIKITSIIVKELQKKLDGVLILYGTDTMAYFSSWHRELVSNYNKSILQKNPSTLLEQLPVNLL